MKDLFILSGEFDPTTKQPNEETILETINIKTRKRKKFKIKSKGLTHAFMAYKQAETATGLAQILIIDLDFKEWEVLPITKELKQKLPFLNVVTKREYVI